VNEDIRKFDFRKLPDKYLIATNLPYYISDYFLRLLTEIENKPCKAVILLQKEVVDKVSAEAGKDSTSALGLMLNYFYIVKGDVTVKASEFNPPPKIDSRLLVLELREKPLIEGVNFKDYVKLIKACFGSKRKNILNNLSSNLKLDKEEVKFKLDKLGIDHTIRAGKLDYSDWRLILNEF
jgi:16S rRNA (adenine1518-N6/adenine1519-N6)-dimethyltransferase